MNTASNEALDAALDRRGTTGPFEDYVWALDGPADISDLAAGLGPVEVAEIIDYCLTLLERKDKPGWVEISGIGLELIAERIKIAPAETMQVVGPMLDQSRESGYLLMYLAPETDCLPDEALPWLVPLVERAETMTEMERIRLAHALLRSEDASAVGLARRVFEHMDAGSKTRKNVEAALKRRGP